MNETNRRFSLHQLSEFGSSNFVSMLGDIYDDCDSKIWVDAWNELDQDDGKKKKNKKIRKGLELNLPSYFKISPLL